MTNLRADTPTPVLYTVAVHRRPRHRPDHGGVHDHRPERGAVAEARRGDQQPDLLPSGRRHGRPGHRRNGLRANTRRRRRRSRSRLAHRRRRFAGSRLTSSSRTACRQAPSTSTHLGRRRHGRADPAPACRSRRGRSSSRSLPAIVQGIHQAFSLAIADTMWISMIATALIAAVAVLGLQGGAACAALSAPTAGGGADEGTDRRDRRRAGVAATE